MTEGKRKSKTGAPRTEVFAMRFDPKLKYLAEIAARKQRRSMANFVEWAIEQALGRVMLVDTNDLSILDESDKLWDLEPSDRFIKLAKNYPNLLTYEEQLIWKAIQELTASETYKDEAGKTQLITYSFTVNEGKNKSPNNFAVKDCWSTLVAFSEGHATEQDVRAALKETIPF